MKFKKNIDGHGHFRTYYLHYEDVVKYPNFKGNIHDIFLY